MDYKNNFAKRLKLARQAAGLTAEQLAEMVDLSAKTIWHLEGGDKGTSIPTLINLCNALHVSPEYLLESSLIDAPGHSDGTIDIFSQLSEEETTLVLALIKTYLNRKSR